MMTRFDFLSTKKILLVSGLALLVVTASSLSVYFYLSKKQTDITVTTKSIQLSIDKKETITDKSIQVDSNKALAEIINDTKVNVPSPLDIETTINNTNSHTTSTLLDTTLQTAKTVKTTRLSIPKRLSPRASQNKPTIVLEDFDSSFDLHDNDDGPTEAEISEAYINLARKSVLENESPKRRAAREAREAKARIEMDNTTTTTQTNDSDVDFGNVEEERRQLSKTAASQAAAVASVHILANASGGRSLRSPLRNESRGMTQSKLVDDHSTTSPKKLADEFASVASPSKVGIRRQIVAEMKVRRYY